MSVRAPELDFMFTDPDDMDAKKVAVWVFFGSHGGYHKYVDERNERNECPISLIPVSTKTNWEALDNLVFRAFKVSSSTRPVRSFVRCAEFVVVVIF